MGAVECVGWEAAWAAAGIEPRIAGLALDEVELGGSPGLVVGPAGGSWAFRVRWQFASCGAMIQAVIVEILQIARADDPVGRNPPSTVAGAAHQRPLGHADQSGQRGFRHPGCREVGR
jgi:hypothetical protein